MPSIDLAGKPIAITGASSGIGWAAAVACARAGMPVAVGARREDKLRELAARIEREGGQAVAIPMDAGVREDCERFIDEAGRRLGPLYAVFANAGVGLEGTLMDLSDQAIDDLFRLNFWGTVWTVRPAVRGMLDRGAGHVLMCSSCVSKIGLPYHAAYSASKAMQDHFGRAMRIELAPRGVHVSTVHPIGTRTEFFDKTKERSGGRRLALTTPDRLMQPPERVADAIVRCLRRPRGEVWTSLMMRLTLAMATAWPSFADRQLRARAAARLKAKDA